VSALSSAGFQLALASQQFIGCPYKFQGRDPELGLDCVGLVISSLQAIGRPTNAPTGYRLRNATIAPFMKFASANGLSRVKGALMPGDIILATPGPGQSHLLIASSVAGFVHAHAGLRRIVHMPGKLPWKALETWRITTE